MARLGFRVCIVALIAVFIAESLSSTPTHAASDPLIPPYAWTRPIGEPFADVGHPKTSYPIIDDGAFQGAPLGGLGAGTIGRTYAGDFARWQLDIGKHTYQSVPVDMFSVYVSQNGASAAQTLYTGAPADKSLSAWKWNYPVGAGTYWALYPRSGFVYSGLPIQLSVEQFSPVIPNNYKESSYPVAVFTYTATNPSDKPTTVGLMFTWQNMLGPDAAARRRANLVNRQVKDSDLYGIQFERKEPFSSKAWDGSMAIAVGAVEGVTPGANLGFNAEGNGAEVWKDFAVGGMLTDSRAVAESGGRGAFAGGISATFTLAPGQTVQVPFYLSWDLPVMTFGTKDNMQSWYRRYTAFFGRDGKQAWSIAREAAKLQSGWRQSILNWQKPILADPGRPDWYKTALFNELYYLVDGGTAWEQGQVGLPAPPASRIGGFLVLECFDYLYYSTFDVDYYASFALMELWPALEERIVDDFAATVPSEDLSNPNVQPQRNPFVRKRAGAIPHDLGGPGESPWFLINLYNKYGSYDVNRWKDLNPKFVLRLYRDSILLNDPDLARTRFPEVKETMAYLAAMDASGVGIPENEAIPDQTYDTWPVTGISAYSGGLWLAALHASQEMAKLAGDSDAERAFTAQLSKAQAAYEKALWTGSYYAYDSSAGPTHDSIMADQLAGQWYLDFVDQSMLPPDHVDKALRTIYANNVMKFAGGKMGAVNGMRPDGQIDVSSEQSQEVWTGVTYAVASMMMNHGLRDEAWQTAYGVYNVTYQMRGYWFRTPEAYDITGSYRASMYMRPLSIWALELAYRQQATHKTTP